MTRSLAVCCWMGLLVGCSSGDKTNESKPKNAPNTNKPVAWQVLVVRDVTGDGVDDIVAKSPHQIVFLNGATKTRLWRADVPDVVDAAVGAGQVLLAIHGSSPRIEALSDKDGKSIWRVEGVKAEQIARAKNGLIVARDAEGHATVFSSTGKRITPDDATVNSIYYASESLVVVGGASGSVSSYGIDNGALAWTAEIPGRPPRHMRGDKSGFFIESRGAAAPFSFTRLSLSNGEVTERKSINPRGNMVAFDPESGARYLFDGFALALKGTITKFDAQLQKVWSAKVKKAGWPIQDLVLTSGPQVTAMGRGPLAQLVFRGDGNAGRLIVFDDTTGVVKAHRDLPDRDSVVGATDHVILVRSPAADAALLALDSASLKPLWSHPLSSRSSRVLVWQGTVYLVEPTGQSIGVSRLAADGKPAWQRALDGASAASGDFGIAGATAGKTLLVLPDNAGQLAVLDLSSGNLTQVSP